jgi:hypothetical protein
MAINRTGPTEYGGKDGLIQQAADGHTLSPAEEAMAMRMLGKRPDTGYYDVDPDAVGMHAGEDTVWVDPEYDRTVVKLNGRNETDLGVNQ